MVTTITHYPYYLIEHISSLQLFRSSLIFSALSHISPSLISPRAALPRSPLLSFVHLLRLHPIPLQFLHLTFTTPYLSDLCQLRLSIGLTQCHHLFQLLSLLLYASLFFILTFISPIHHAILDIVFGPYHY